MSAPYEVHRRQIAGFLTAFGMPAENAESTAEIMAWADLHGIDSHGISMIPTYAARAADGKMRMRAEPRIVKETPVSALVDGDGGLGHVTSRLAMNTAIAKAQTIGIGIGVAAVRNSAHFGACGFYAKMAADAGLIGLVTTSASGIQVAPTGGAQARLGTDPIAFAAPGRDGEPFLLDMATTTVAAGRIRNLRALWPRKAEPCSCCLRWKPPQSSRCLSDREWLRFRSQAFEARPPPPIHHCSIGHYCRGRRLP